jgi:hypothetical protein
MISQYFMRRDSAFFSSPARRQNAIAGTAAGNMATLVSAVACASLFVAIASAHGQGLLPACTLPFASIAKHHPIDENCDARGEADEDPKPKNRDAHALQNQAKNNFCPPLENPALVTFVSFRKLQQKLDQVPKATTWWRENLPKSLRTFGLTSGSNLACATLLASIQYE